MRSAAVEHGRRFAVTSVVIAAHNEGAVIGRCLDSLARQEVSEHGWIDITVAANGCTDDTIAVARGRGVRVIDVDQASKAVALNAADRVAKGFPRIYLDADIEMPPNALAAFTDVLSSEGVLAAAPRRRIDVNGSPLLVRAYFAISSRLPAFERALFGRGMVALSSNGRARFETFPLMVADDLFLDSLFSAEEKATVADVEVVVSAPRRTGDLVRRLTRVRRGNAAMRRAGRDGSVPVQIRTADRLSWLREVVIPDPRLAPAGVVYAILTVLAAVLARRPADSARWERDESTRLRSATDERS